MNSLQANIKNETEKIILHRRTKVFLIVSALIPIGAATTFSLLQNSLGIFGLTTASFSVMLLGLFTSILLPLFIFAVAADVFAGEVGDKTLKLTLTRPISRWHVFLSKNIAIAVYIGINLGVVLLVSVLAGLFLQGSGDFSKGLLQTFISYLAAMVPMLSIGIAAVFIAQFFKNASSALFTGVFIYLVGKALAFLYPATARLILFSYTNWHLLWLGSTVGAGRLINGLVVMIAYGILLLSIGFYLFDKTEV